MNKKLLTEKVSNYLKEHYDEYINILSQLIEIDSVASASDGKYVFGKKSAEAIDKILEIAAKDGFHTENHDYYCASVVYGDKEQELGIIAHVDVVPAGDGWTFPPYRLTVKDGLLIGRGTEDDKGPAVAAYMTMRYLKDNDIRLPFSVRLLLGGNEENGMHDIPHFLIDHKAPTFSFTPDSEFPVCIGEKGAGKLTFSLCDKTEKILELNAGTVTNAVCGKAVALIAGIGKDSLPANEHIAVSYEGENARITAVGRTAHAAQPENGLNAIHLLAEYLLENIDFSEEEKTAVTFLKESTSGYKGEFFGIEEYKETMSYLTCISGLAWTENGKLYQNFNVRYPIPDSWDYILKNAIDKAKAFGANLTFEEHDEGYLFSADKPEIKALTDACAFVTGDECKPYTTGGGTYARSFPNTAAFGTTQEKYRNRLGNDRGKAHDRDEYLSIAEFEDSVRIFVLGILEIAENY